MRQMGNYLSVFVCCYFWNQTKGISEEHQSSNQAWRWKWDGLGLLFGFFDENRNLVLYKKKTNKENPEGESPLSDQELQLQNSSSDRMKKKSQSDHLISPSVLIKMLFCELEVPLWSSFDVLKKHSQWTFNDEHVF